MTTDVSARASWRIVGLHHVAFAHGPDASPDDALCRLLDVTPHEESGPGFVERMFPVGDAFIQTLEASGDGLIQRFLDARGPALHHVAFEVDRIDAALAALHADGVRLVDTEARDGGMGTRIAFVHPSAFGGMLVELVEPGPAEATG
ncbi:MAG: methylmalonyl-CoA/ethylmalonyl-CoA epimerase [Actinomycetota bacterium]|nr:methylmalonyl-CoA/ethylmalonyl-CoA epimerase [Actinomycetota bacterium]